MKLRARGSWLASGVVHVLLVLALGVGFAERGRERVAFFNLAAPRVVPMPEAPLTTPNRIPRAEPHVVPVVPPPPALEPPPSAARPPEPAASSPTLAAAAAATAGVAAVAPAAKPEAGERGSRTMEALIAGAIAAGGVKAGQTGENGAQPTGPIIAAPKLSDVRIWPQARPALPTGVASALYGAHHDSLPRDSVAVHRLKAMVDSLNVMIDSEQRIKRKPSWTTDVGGKKWGMDSSSIYVAGVKIPNAVLAMLGNMLPQGNFDESLRERELQYMSEDIMQAARRAQTMEDFRRYVREERAEHQRERDFERRQREGDTVKTKAKRDTLTP